MKKIILLFIASVISSEWSSAQITITSADLPQAGYTYLTNTDTTPSISLGTPSASSQNWNFSSLSSDYPSFPTFGLTSSTPYASAFSASNIYTYGPAAMFGGIYGGAPVGSQGMSKGHMFWSTGTTGYRIVGFRSDSGAYAGLNVFENPQELLIGTPSTYNTSFNNTARWELPVSNVNPSDPDTFYVSYLTKTLIADAWGSLTTPFSTFNNILRIHENLIKIDSAYYKQGSTVLYAMELMRDTSNNYLYLANGINYPAARVHADKNNIVKNVEYYSGFLLAGINDYSGYENTEIRVFPNPFSESTTLKINDHAALPTTAMNSGGIDDLKLHIYDALGKEVSPSVIHNPDGFVIQRGNLPSGFYLYKVVGNNGFIQTGKIIIR